MFWVIHLEETDGDIMMWPCKTMQEVEDYAAMTKLHRTDYAIVHGEKIKDFGDYIPNKREW